jgi:hypothetical protein
MKIPPKKFVQRKMPGKKFAWPLRQRKKNRASKVQIVLKKILAEVKCIKKILQRHETDKKKIVPQKFYTPPPGISNGPPSAP